jgi:hypothetical protein
MPDHHYGKKSIAKKDSRIKQPGGILLLATFYGESQLFSEVLHPREGSRPLP